MDSRMRNTSGPWTGQLSDGAFSILLRQWARLAPESYAEFSQLSPRAPWDREVRWAREAARVFRARAEEMRARKGGLSGPADRHDARARRLEAWVASRETP